MNGSGEQHHETAGERAKSIVDSTVLRGLQTVITTVGVPLLFLVLNGLLSKLEALQASISEFKERNAVFENRLRTVEVELAEHRTAIRASELKIAEHTFSLQQREAGRSGR